MTQTTRYISVTECAKLMRKDLKANFPGITFSVRSSSYAGGAHVCVNWTDGPTEKAVESVIGQYEGSDFDSSIDLKSYHDSELNGESVHYGNDNTSLNRSLSVEFLTAVAKAYCERYNENMPTIALCGNSAYILDRAYSAGHDCCWDILRKAGDTDAAQLDTMFAEEDRELAEYLARQQAQIASTVKEKPYVSPIDRWRGENGDPDYSEDGMYNNVEPELQEPADDNWTFYSDEPLQHQEELQHAEQKADAQYRLVRLASVPGPCDIEGCHNQNATVAIHITGEGAYAICPECIRAMAAMNSDNEEFLHPTLQEPQQEEDDDCGANTLRTL